MIEVGKLYSCSKYLLHYPDRETAVAAVADTSTAAAAAHPVAAAEISTAAIAATAAWRAEASCSYWSNQFDKPVNYYNPQTPLLVLSVKEEYIQVLAGDKKGWIINMDWLEIKDIR
jgi:hypothetical protein